MMCAEALCHRVGAEKRRRGEGGGRRGSEALYSKNSPMRMQVAPLNLCIFEASIFPSIRSNIRSSSKKGGRVLVAPEGPSCNKELY